MEDIYEIADTFQAVTLAKFKYEELIRKSERIDILERLYKANKGYVSCAELEAICGIEQPVGKEGEEA